MFNKPIKIGQYETRNNVFLAPLAGYTNYPFRLLCAGYGAGLCFTEMVSAKGLKYGSENTKELLYTHPKEGLTAVQIFGSDPAILRAACESEELSAFPIVDINMGCPVPKIYKNGEGSALLEDPKKAENIVKECVKSGKIITVKFRIGITEENYVTTEFAKRMEGAGASLITIHGRTKDKVYAGEVHFQEIAAAKNAVKIPVIANGGVFSNADAEKLIQETGADGVMVARASLFDPQIFCELTNTPKENRLEMFQKQMKWTRQVCDERFTTVFMRKMAAFYVKGTRGAAAFKDRLFQAQTPDEILSIAEEIWSE
jgi:tRNA-dihydrouridine synthase B